MRTQPLPDLAGIASANKTPKTLDDYGFRDSSGSLAIFTAIRCVLSQLMRELSSGAASSGFLTPPLHATGPLMPIPNCRSRSPTFRSGGRFREPSCSVNDVVGDRPASFDVVLCQTFGYPAQRARPGAHRLRRQGEPCVPRRKRIKHQRESNRIIHQARVSLSSVWNWVWNERPNWRPLGQQSLLPFVLAAFSHSNGPFQLLDGPGRGVRSRQRL